MKGISQTYTGIFTNKDGTHEVPIINNFDVFSVEINGVQFEGDSLDDLEIIYKQRYTAEQLEYFTFINNAICDYTLSVRVPQSIIDNRTNAIISTHLKVEWTLGKLTENGRRTESRKLQLSIAIENEIFEGSSDAYFDDAFDQLIKRFNGRYSFKNCYICLYGDYSPYGQQSFGGMYCFVRQKETYSCNQFKQRIKGTGHRGYTLNYTNENQSNSFYHFRYKR